MTVALILAGIAGLAVGFVIGALMPGSTVDWDRLDRGRDAEWARITAAIDGYELDALNDAYARLINEEHR